MRKVKMSWPELDVAVEFELEEANKELCDEFWNELPLVAVQEHASVSGEMMYCWVNMLSFAKVPFRSCTPKVRLAVCPIRKELAIKSL